MPKSVKAAGGQSEKSSKQGFDYAAEIEALRRELILEYSTVRIWSNVAESEGDPQSGPFEQAE